MEATLFRRPVDHAPHACRHLRLEPEGLQMDITHLDQLGFGVLPVRGERPESEPASCLHAVQGDLLVAELANPPFRHQLDGSAIKDLAEGAGAAHLSLRGIGVGPSSAEHRLHHSQLASSLPTLVAACSQATPLLDSMGTPSRSCPGLFHILQEVRPPSPDPARPIRTHDP